MILVRRMALAALVLLGLGFMTPRNADPDLWGHIRFGRYYLDAGLPPQPDIFSYADGLPWINHEWLAEVTFAAGWYGAGTLGYFLVKFLLGVALCALAISNATKRAAGPAATAIGFCLMCICIQPGLTLRPQLFTFVLTAYWLFAWFRYRDGSKKWIYATPLLAALWGNLHAGVVVGVGLMGLFAIGEMIERKKPWLLLALTAASAAATLVNPQGLEYWRYLARAIPLPRPNITEWRPLSLVRPADLPGWICMAATAFVFLRSRHRRAAAEWLVLGVTAILAIRHLRHLMLFGIAMGMILPPHLDDLLKRWGIGTGGGELSATARRIFIGAFAAAGLFILGASVVRGMEIPVNPGRYPVGAVRFLKANGVAGNIYPTFNWGEYAIWHLHPGCLVGADGRYETVYTRDHDRAVMGFDTGGGDWREILDRYPTEIVLCPNSARNAERMNSRADFAPIFRDSCALVYVKRIPRFADLIVKADRGELPAPAVAPVEYFP